MNVVEAARKVAADPRLAFRSTRWQRTETTVVYHKGCFNYALHGEPVYLGFFSPDTQELLADDFEVVEVQTTPNIASGDTKNCEEVAPRLGSW